MDSAAQVRERFKEYASVIDAELWRVFEPRLSLPMYGHLAYFMGFLDEDLQPVTRYGGKRFRSSLCLMFADWYGAREAGVPVALSVELFHNFTLMHDDIFDGDTYRRGQKTVWNVWGTNNAINSGDAQSLFANQVVANAYREGVLENAQVQCYLNEQYLRVLEGQYIDFELTNASLGDTKANDDIYMNMIQCKTADLISAAAKGAGLAADVSDKEAQALHNFGQQLGIAYQICDDTVSVWASSEATGKRARGDILEKKKTLPVLYAYEQLSTDEKERLLALYNAEGELDERGAREVVALLDSVDTYGEMKRRIDEYAAAAKGAADALSLSVAQKDMLKSIVDMLLPDAKKL